MDIEALNERETIEFTRNFLLNTIHLGPSRREKGGDGNNSDDGDDGNDVDYREDSDDSDDGDDGDNHVKEWS